MDKEIICSFENLYKAYRRAKSGKGCNNSCAKFQNMSLEGVHLLKEQLENQTYRMNPYNEFKIYEPKERIIQICTPDVLAALKQYKKCFKADIDNTGYFFVNRLSNHLSEQMYFSN